MEVSKDFSEELHSVSKTRAPVGGLDIVYWNKEVSALDNSTLVSQSQYDTKKNWYDEIVKFG